MHLRATHVVATLALAVFLAASPSASASSITFVCKFDICRVEADGSKLRHLTRSFEPYQPRSLAVSEDRKVMTFERKDRYYVADGRARHRRLLRDASFAQVNRDGVHLLFNHFGNGPTDRTLCVGKLRSYPKAERCLTHLSALEPRWGAGTGLIGNDGDSGLRRTGRGCVLTRSGRCGRTYARADRGREIHDASVSPNGRLAAVSQTLPEGGYHLLLFDFRTGRRIRYLAADSGNAPSWSPDSQRVAFVRHEGVFIGDGERLQGDLWTVNARGKGERKLIADEATQPSWTR